MLRNKEIRKFLILFSLMAITTIVLGFTINYAAGILTTISSIAFGIAFLMFTKARYKSIAKISDEIDIVLHNVEHVYIDESNE